MHLELTSCVQRPISALTTPHYSSPFSEPCFIMSSQHPRRSDFDTFAQIFRFCDDARVENGSIQHSSDTGSCCKSLTRNPFGRVQ